VLQRRESARAAPPLCIHNQAAWVERCVKSMENLRKIISMQQRDWDWKLPFFLRPIEHQWDRRHGTHQHGVHRTPISAMWIAVWGSPQQRAIHDYLHIRPHGTPAWHPSYGCQHLKVATDGMKYPYNCLTWTRGKSPKPQSSWEGSSNIVTRVNDIAFWIQHHPRAKMVLVVVMVHLNRLTPCLYNVCKACESI
jgi:hypothetical protein